MIVGSDGRSIVLPSIFFQLAEQNWLRPESLPMRPLETWDAGSVCTEAILLESEVPIIYGDISFSGDAEKLKDAGLTQASPDLFIPIDIFGSSFFMLSRYEEAVVRERDSHDRFKSTAALACQEGYLDRPIINEYIEILWANIIRLWPRTSRMQRVGRTLVSCDVDFPFCVGAKSIKKMIRQVGSDLLKRRSILRAGREVVSTFAARTGSYQNDHNYAALNWIMDVNESFGNRVAFYFLTGDGSTAMDGCYTLEDPLVENIIRQIHLRGHEVGLHASYDTYTDLEKTTTEANHLRRCFDKLSISQQAIGSRQHYLRWKSSDTASNLNAAGLKYDSSLSYADRAGFRCGICYDYSMYDLVKREKLNLLQRPLIAMECSIVDQAYEGLGYSDLAVKRFLELKEACLRFQGNFTLLWHNSYFTGKQDKLFYEKLIQ